MLEDTPRRCHAIGRIVCLALSLLLVPLASAAQPPGKIYRVSYLAPAQPINVREPAHFDHAFATIILERV
jgi:putative tryptophan/tyrosine transport system substrate-binding protein